MNQNRNNPIAGMLGQLLRQNPQMQSNPLAQNMISVIQNGDDAKGEHAPTRTYVVPSILHTHA